MIAASAVARRRMASSRFWLTVRLARHGRACQRALPGNNRQGRPAAMLRTALYAGSFDPVTNGHLDVVRQAAGLADKLVLAVGVHPGKTPMFATKDRLAMLEEICGPVARKAGCRLACVTFDYLVITAANSAGATILIRGLRDGTDFDYEMQMSGMNGIMAPSVQTVFLPASPAVRHITATLVRQIGKIGGDITSFVPPAIAARMKAKLGS